MNGLWRRYPWLPLALLMAFFALAWVAWLITAIRHAPESVPTSPPPAQQNAAPR